MSPNIQPCCSHELDTGNHVELAMSSQSSKSTNNESFGTNLSITTVLWLANSGHLWSDFENYTTTIYENINVWHPVLKKYVIFHGRKDCGNHRAINWHQLDLRVHLLKHQLVHYNLDIVYRNDQWFYSTTWTTTAKRCGKNSCETYVASMQRNVSYDICRISPFLDNSL